MVVLAIPLLIFLFHRVEAYYGRAARDLDRRQSPPPRRNRTLVLVPVTGVSRLTQHAITEDYRARGGGHGGLRGLRPGPGGPPEVDVERLWHEWDPGVPLRVLHTDYASIVRPIVGWSTSCGPTVTTRWSS